MAWKFHEPIGSSLLAPFLIRTSLGAYFIMAGLVKLHQIQAFIEQVQAFKILPANVATLYAALLPYAEIAVGGLLLVGFWTTLAGAMASLLLLSFVVAIGPFPTPEKIFNKDIILLCCSLSVVFSGAGAFSLDRFRKLASA